MILSVPIYASHGASEGVSIPAKPSNDTIYYWLPVVPDNQTQSNETAQSTTANATIRPREGINVTPQPTTPTTPVAPTTATAEQEERQIDPNYKPEYSSQEAYNATVVAETSEASVEGGGGIPSTEGDVPIDRCHEFGNVDTSNFTPEQFAEHMEKVKKYKEEMEGKCAPDSYTPPEGAIELPRETEEDKLGELILFKETLNSLSEEEREAMLKFEGITMEYIEREIERLRNLTTAKNNTSQEIIAEEPKKEEGDGFVSIVTNFVVSLIDNIFSIFR